MKKLLLSFGLAVLSILTMGVAPIVSPRLGTIYPEEKTFRQFMAGDSLIIRKASDNDPVEIWVSPQLSWARIRSMAEDSLAVSPAGGKMYFMPGTYSVPDNQPLQPPSGVTLEGVSRGPNIAEFRLTGSLSAQKIINLANDQDNITIRNLVFNGNLSSGWGSGNRYGITLNSTTGANDDITIEGCRFRQFTHAIRVESGATSYNLRFMNNEIVGNTLEDEAVNCGIFIHESSITYYAKIEGNVIYGSNYTGVNSRDGWAIYFGGKRSSIVNNKIHDFRTSNGGGIGIYLVDGAERNTVMGNNFHTVYGDNISVRGDHNNIIGNFSHFSQDQGIVVENASKSNITGNYIENSQTTGIRCINSSSISITSNYIETAGQNTSAHDSYEALISITNLSSSAPFPDAFEVLDNIHIVGNYGKMGSSNVKWGLLIDETDEATDETSNIYVADNFFEPGNIDTLYGGAYFPSKVISFREELPLYPYCVFKDATVGYVGIPNDNVADTKAIQRWIDLSSANRLTAIPGAPGEFFIDRTVELSNNTHIDGRGKGTFQMISDMDGVDWGALTNYYGFFHANQDTNVLIENLTFCGNTGNITVADNANIFRKHIAIGITEDVADIVIRDNHLCDWSQGIWIGTGPTAGGGNEDIHVVHNYFSVQTFYASSGPGPTAIDPAIGCNALFVSLSTPGDTLNGLNFSDNTIVDEGVPVVGTSHATSPTVLAFQVSGNVYASSIRNNYYRVPVASFTRSGVAITDSVHTQTNFERKAP